VPLIVELRAFQFRGCRVGSRLPLSVRSKTWRYLIEAGQCQSGIGQRAPATRYTPAGGALLCPLWPVGTVAHYRPGRQACQLNAEMTVIEASYGARGRAGPRVRPNGAMGTRVFCGGTWGLPAVKWSWRWSPHAPTPGASPFRAAPARFARWEEE